MNHSHCWTRSDLSRRAMLRGVGVSVALPWLESLPAWGTEKTAANGQAPVRFACLFSGNGFHAKQWWARGQQQGSQDCD